MLKKLVALCGLALALALLALGYEMTADSKATTRTLSAGLWPHDFVNVAVTIDSYPLFFSDGGKRQGLFVDLLQQAPLANVPWQVAALNEQDAMAAVSVQAVDLALLCVVRGYETSALSHSAPLLSSRLSLFSSTPSIPGGTISHQRIAWSGPDSVAELLLRQGAQPVTASSIPECLARAAASEVAACATDEDMGVANIARQGLSGQLFVTGEPLGTLDYVLGWHSADPSVSTIIADWLRDLRATGILDTLQRKWVGTRVVSASTSTPSLLLIGLAAASVTSMIAAASLGYRNRVLLQEMRSHSSDWTDSATKYRALVEGANDAIFVLTPEQASILEVNQKAELLTGFSRESLVRMRFHQLLPTRHKRLLREWLLDRTDSGRVEEVPLVRSDGSIATVEISSKVVTSGKRSVRLCIVRNITERKLMQREIKRVTEFAERVLENMTNGLLTVDADGLVTSYNKALTQILEPGADPVGHQIDEIVRTQGEPLGKLVQSAIANGTTQRHNVSLLSRGASPISASVTISLLRDEQAVIGAILVFTDTSQETKAREEWQRLAMLSALGQMSGVLAHDIRNRVTGVHVGVQYLAEKFPPDDPRRQSMEFIRLETDRIVQIIDDILMLIRPGRTDRTPCYMSDIIERVVRAQTVLAQQRRVQILATVAPALPPISADSVQIERALNNLAKNAVEAMANGGKVQLIVDAVSQNEGSRKTATIRIRIADNGPGIPASVRARLFQPFVSEKKGGTGLGLSIAKRIIDEHGGHIEVETREGQGTTFTVCLPAIAERGT